MDIDPPLNILDDTIPQKEDFVHKNTPNVEKNQNKTSKVIKIIAIILSSIIAVIVIIILIIKRYRKLKKTHKSELDNIKKAKDSLSKRCSQYEQQLFELQNKYSEVINQLNMRKPPADDDYELPKQMIADNSQNNSDEDDNRDSNQNNNVNNNEKNRRYSKRHSNQIDNQNDSDYDNIANDDTTNEDLMKIIST